MPKVVMPNGNLQSLYYVASLVSGHGMNFILRCDWLLGRVHVTGAILPARNYTLCHAGNSFLKPKQVPYNFTLIFH